MMILIAPDKFKGSLTALEAARAIGRGIKRSDPEAETILLPLADGGEGTVDAVIHATGGIKKEIIVSGPLGTPIKTYFGIIDSTHGPRTIHPTHDSQLMTHGSTAIIEMALASGLQLIPEEKRNPLLTTTYGTGELITAALDARCKRIIVGIGGSATNDAGMGMVQALGVKFYDKDNREQITGNGKDLKNIRRIDKSGLDPRIKDTEFVVASDVKNPLYGPEGAAHIYAPQKGATPEAVEELDKGLRNFAMVVKDDLDLDVASIPGSGAAGGLGAGLIVFTGAKIVYGIDLIMELVGFFEKARDADLVITGEGKIDEQSFFGKVISGVSGSAKKAGVPVVAVGGQVTVEEQDLKKHDIDLVYSLVDGVVAPDYAMQNAAKLLEDKTTQMYYRLKQIMDKT
jgi:glycerate kinase